MNPVRKQQAYDNFVSTCDLSLSYKENVRNLLIDFNTYGWNHETYYMILEYLDNQYPDEGV